MIKELSILLILVLFVSLVGVTLNTFLVENTVAGVATTWECRKYVKSNDQLFIKIEKENNEESTFWLDFDHGFCSDRVVEGNVGDNLIINYASIDERFKKIYSVEVNHGNLIKAKSYEGKNKYLLISKKRLDFFKSLIGIEK